ncbi:hypothetical protein TNCV_2946441 [Trichonephila clavipes]|nr:hypothetical protein TNCV_2946441 [Trichonephila clavipes]
MATPPISTSTVLPWNWRGGKYSQVPCTRDSAHRKFGSTDLTSTYAVCTPRIFGGIGHQTQAFRSRVLCSNHQVTQAFNYSIIIGSSSFCTCITQFKRHVHLMRDSQYRYMSSKWPMKTFGLVCPTQGNYADILKLKAVDYLFTKGP